MNNSPLVSVLMTAYNRAQYIAEAIESVLASTYTNFELIVVDDCSKDDTVAVAKKYESDERVKVYVNEKNLGDYPNRNKAASLAKGKYIKYWDSDDIIYPHCLDVMVRCMEQFPEAGFGLMKPHLPHFPDPYPLQIDKPFELFIDQQDLFSNSPGSSIMRLDKFNEAGCFSGKRYVGDYEFWLIISQITPLVIIPSFLGWDRVHAGQERDFDTESYEKLRIDAIANAFEVSTLPNKEELKQKLLKNRLDTSYKIMLKNALSLKISSAMMKQRLISYLNKKFKAIT